MATTADIKNGMCIELDGKTFSIVEFLHVKPGKGPAFVRTKLKNLENGRILDKTFSAGERIEPVRVERRPYQFTYEDDMGAHFMHTETFEEITIDKAMIENADLMTDGQIVEVMFHTDKEMVLSAELPPIVDMEVTYTEPGIKGDTASSNSLKAATVNTGATVKVPLFINTGDKIRWIPAPANITKGLNNSGECIRKQQGATDGSLLFFGAFPAVYGYGCPVREIFIPKITAGSMRSCCAPDGRREPACT